MMLYKPERAV